MSEEKGCEILYKRLNHAHSSIVAFDGQGYNTSIRLQKFSGKSKPSGLPWLVVGSVWHVVPKSGWVPYTVILMCPLEPRFVASLLDCMTHYKDYGTFAVKGVKSWIKRFEEELKNCGGNIKWKK